MNDELERRCRWVLFICLVVLCAAIWGIAPAACICVVSSQLFENIPTTRFSSVVIDPPWPITMAGKRSKKHVSASHLPYSTLTVEEICLFPLGSLAEEGGHIYLWTTNRFLRSAFDVLDAWGVRFHLCMPLVKRSGICPCNGYVFASEFCLLGFYGKPMLRFKSMGRLNWLETNPIPGKHSAKSDEFYSLVETISPGPYLDCFARRPRTGWAVWGNEIAVQEDPVQQAIVA